MKKNPSKKRSVPAEENLTDAFEVSPEMIEKRARELATINNRPMSVEDRIQARRELLGEPEGDPKENYLESVSEAARWDPVPGSAGHQAVERPPEDEEDEDGHNDTARLVEKGINEASRDQMLGAAKRKADEDREQ